MINAQCFHMGEKRAPTQDKKATLERIAKINAWLEKEMSSVLNSF